MAWLWPKITNVEEAKQAAQQGAAYAAVVAALTTLVSAYALYVGHAVIGIDGWGLVDASIFAVAAWRLYRYSFPWAIAGLAMMIAEVAFKVSAGQGPGFLGILIIAGLLAGVRGTFFIRKELKRQAKFALVVPVSPDTLTTSND
jgi:hypothetical protein